jgi:ketosteroid isomerase-like protein
MQCQVIEFADASEPCKAAALNEMFSMTSSISWIWHPPAKFVVAGDYAFVHATSENRASLVDGTQYESQGRTTTVAHRGSDGHWRYVIDHSSTL